MQKSLFGMLLLAALPLAAQTPAPIPAATPAPAPTSALRLPRTSPVQLLKQTVGLTDVTITYSRPNVKGRPIWGGLVPYGKVWRTGANDATTIAFSTDVTIDGQKLAAGTYSLHTIPGESSWIIAFNTVAEQWGSFHYDSAKDALRVTVKPMKADFRESMEFEIPEVTTDNARVEIRWENVAAPFTIGTDATAAAMAGIRAALASAKADDWRTPLRGAQFANDVRDTANANAWIERSIAIQPNINNLFIKAQIQARAGDKSAAVATAQAAIAKAGPDDKEEVGEIQKSIDMWKK